MSKVRILNSAEIDIENRNHRCLSLAIMDAERISININIPLILLTVTGSLVASNVDIAIKAL